MQVKSSTAVALAAVVIVTVVLAGLVMFIAASEAVPSFDVIKDTGGELEVLFASGIPFATLGVGISGDLQMCEAAASYYGQFCHITSACSVVSGGDLIIQGDSCPGGGFGQGTSSSPSHFSEQSYRICLDVGGSFVASGTQGGSCSVPLPELFSVTFDDYASCAAVLPSYQNDPTVGLILQCEFSAGFYVIHGYNIPFSCVSGSLRVEGLNVLECAADGRSEAVVLTCIGTVPSITNNQPQCLAETCEPGSLRAVGAEVQECSSEGTVWTTIQACGFNEQASIQGGAGVCVPQPANPIINFFAIIFSTIQDLINQLFGL